MKAGFYKKSIKAPKKENDLIAKASRKANNQLAWDLISKGADVKAVCTALNFTIDNFLDVDDLEPPKKSIPIPPKTRYLVG